MAFYTPNSIATRPVVGTDSPYVMPIGVVTTYDPVLSGAVTLLFPAAPVDGSVVIIKNATADPTPITLNPNGNTFEAPDTSDTAYLTTGTVSHSAPKQSYRWIFDGTDTWWIDHSYKPNEERSVLVTSTTYTPKRPGEIMLVDTTTAGAGVTIIVPEGWPDDSKFTVVKASVDDYKITVQRSGTTETFFGPRFGWTVNSFILFDADECVSMVLQGDVWYPYAINVRPYIELWTVAVNTNMPIVGAAAPLTYQSNSTGDATSRLFSSSGGVLTALGDFIVNVDVQSVMWVNLSSNNSAVYGTLAPSTTATAFIGSSLRAGVGGSRPLYLPQSVSGSWALETATGSTFQINMQSVIEEGTGDVDLGDSLATPPDEWGMVVGITLD